jgi:hypothetical protein
MAAISHKLSFSIRFVDHFTGTPVAKELPVRIDGTFQYPTRHPGGKGRRQNDGTYRFLSLPPGAHRILWHDPFVRAQHGWTRWDPDPEVALPLADPSTPIDAVLWPTAAAKAPVSATGVRGKLVGPDVANLIVRIAPQLDAFDRQTRSDQAGEFLFLPPGRLAAGPTGLIPMHIEVRNPDDSPRVVSGWRPGTKEPLVPGTNFTFTPRRVTRILFEIV